MNWHEKISKMSIDELAEFLGTSKHEDFISEACKRCTCNQEDGFCAAAKREDMDRACTVAMKAMLQSEVSDENK